MRNFCTTVKSFLMELLVWGIESEYYIMITKWQIVNNGYLLLGIINNPISTGKRIMNYQIINLIVAFASFFNKVIIRKLLYVPFDFGFA